MNKFILSSVLFFLFNINVSAQTDTSISNESLRKLFIISGHNGIPPGVEYGGMVLFKQNLAQVHACEIKKYYPNTLLYVDQEGGNIRRFEQYNLPSPKEAVKNNNINQYNELLKKTAQGLKDNCIDVNLAPYVELKDENNRSYGSNYKKTKQYATMFVNTMNQYGIKSVLKHFPGEADQCKSVTDLSHLGLKIKKNSEVYICNILDKIEFDKNVEMFIDVPSDAVMIGQGIYTQLSPYPALLEPQMRVWLVNKLKYKKPIISDALWEIEATPQTIIRALKTVDFVMVGTPKTVEDSLPYIQEAIKKGELKKEDIQHKISLFNSFQKNE